METQERTQHWENIYETRPFEEVSWYQPKPETSLKFIASTGIDKNAAIIDVGGGDSYLVDHLLDDGYTNVTVLDISSKAIDRAKKRLGPRAEKVNWIASDITEFNSDRRYDLWHDRAALHFLRDKADQEAYLQKIVSGVKSGGYAVIGTFAEGGPEKCSGIVVQQYSPESMTEFLGEHFEPIELKEVEHLTPKDIVQEFVFGVFKRK